MVVKKMCRVFHRLVKRNIGGLVVPLVKTSLNIYCWIWSWKNCGNLSASATVMCRSIVATFCLTVACFCITLYDEYRVESLAHSAPDSSVVKVSRLEIKKRKMMSLRKPSKEICESGGIPVTKWHFVFETCKMSILLMFDRYWQVSSTLPSPFTYPSPSLPSHTMPTLLKFKLRVWMVLWAQESRAFECLLVLESLKGSI